MNVGFEMQGKLLVKKDKVIFTELARASQTQKCTWRDDKTNPCYCKNADLKFEAYLPDRKYLVRFSAQCTVCYDETTTGVHLYCEYCDEVLTGSIAGPGGKISDHLITIRHVYQQAVTLNAILERSQVKEQSVEMITEDISKLEEWSERIRYPMRTTIKRIHFEEVLCQLHCHLAQFTSRRSVSRVRRPYIAAFRPCSQLPLAPCTRTHPIQTGSEHRSSTLNLHVESPCQLHHPPSVMQAQPEAACPAPPSLLQPTHPLYTNPTFHHPHGSFKVRVNPSPAPATLSRACLCTRWPSIRTRSTPPTSGTPPTGPTPPRAMLEGRTSTRPTSPSSAPTPRPLRVRAGAGTARGTGTALRAGAVGALRARGGGARRAWLRSCGAAKGKIMTAWREGLRRGAAAGDRDGTGGRLGIRSGLGARFAPRPPNPTPPAGNGVSPTWPDPLYAGHDVALHPR
jgi:hypothetical protein